MGDLEVGRGAADVQFKRGGLGGDGGSEGEFLEGMRLIVMFNVF
jgi:hypothetical protein